MGLQAAVPTPLRTAMIVEDDGAIRGLLTIAMEDEGYEISTAVDGQDALDQLQRVLPSVLLTDLQMPRLNGWQLIAALRRDPRTCHIAVIVISAQRTQATAEDLGICVYLSKPFALDALFELLDDVFRDLATTAERT